MDTISDAKHSSRRRHDAVLKAQVLAECAKPEASVASVAMAHGINANLVHKWRRLAAATSEPVPQRLPPIQPPTAAFIPLAGSACSMTSGEEMIIELRRGALTVKVTWPLAAAAQCASWMRELLR